MFWTATGHLCFIVGTIEKSNSDTGEDREILWLGGGQVRVNRVLRCRSSGHASGVECARLATGQSFTVSCRAVVCSAGSLHSPALLLRSRVPNARVGKGLRLHPVLPCTASFERDRARLLAEDAAFSLGRGAPMTAVCEHDRDGPLGETCFNVPTTVCAILVGVFQRLRHGVGAFWTSIDSVLFEPRDTCESF